MISTMDMTTSQWEIGYTDPDTGFASVVAAPHRDAYGASLALRAGLCEHAAVQPLHAGMPAALAAQDVDDFLGRMDGTVR